MRWLLACGMAVVALGAPPRTSRAQGPATHTLLVRVQTELERVALGYSVVAIPSLGLERFTSASGQVALPVPSTGPVLLRVKRLGFTPKDTTVIVTDATSQVVTVALARVSFRLHEVRVLGWPPCTEPGTRGMGSDPQLRAIVDQLRQNAERYRLLTTSYPFFYTMRREMGRRADDGSYIAESQDVLPVSGTPDWQYRPGTLVARESGSSQWMMRIPSISDLAEEAFVENHCFHVAGLEEKEGVRLLRLDIIAAQRLRSVDANVVVWLDPEGYQLRHATFTLSKPPTQVRGLLGATSRVRYREVLPFVPVMEFLLAEHTVQSRPPRGPRSVFVERQTIQGVIFRGARPDSLLADSLPPPRPRA